MDGRLGRAHCALCERYAQRVAAALNEGVLQDAVEAGLEQQGEFTVDAVSVLDALMSAGVKLVRDDEGETGLHDAARDRPRSGRSRVAA
jgi:hypothetical protein